MFSDSPNYRWSKARPQRVGDEQVTVFVKKAAESLNEYFNIFTEAVNKTARAIEKQVS